MSGVTDKETIDSLKQEIDYLRSKNEQMMMLVKKASDSNPVPSPSVPSISPEVDLNGNDILTKNVGVYIDVVDYRNISEACFIIICVHVTRIRGNSLYHF